MKKRSFALLALLLVVPLMFALIGCGDDDDAAGTAPLAIGIDADYNGYVGEGMTSQLQAWGVYKNGDIKNITNTASWSSVVKDAATVSGKGLVTGVATGKTAVIASLNGTKASVEITVGTIDAVTIYSSESTDVTGSTETVVTGSARQLTVEATVGGIDIDVTDTATWTSSVGADVSVVDGLVTGITTDGVSNIVAAIGNKTGAVEVTSVANPATLTVDTVDDITTTPNESVMYMGTTRQFEASATSAGGSGDAYDVTDYVTWDSATPATATIDATGLVTAVTTTAATTDITASLGDAPTASDNTVELTVEDTVASITVTPIDPDVLVGSTKAMTATAGVDTPTNGATYTFDATTLAAWTSSAPAIATVGASTGVVTGVLNGTSAAPETSDITATLDVADTSTVTVIAVPTVHSVAIEYSAGAGGGTIINMPAGVSGPGAFTVTAIYNTNDGGGLTGAMDVTDEATFTSDATGVATVISFPDTDASDEGFNGWVFLKKVGLANVTASVDDVSSTTGVLAYVEETTKLDITPLTASTTLGTMVSTDTWLSATATIASGATMDVSCSVAWSSDNKAAANMSAASIDDTCGLGLSTAAGTANVSAKINGVKSTADAVITAN